MNLPISFPSSTDVIREEVARFRALTPEARLGSLDEMFRLYHFLRNVSGAPERIDRVAEYEEQLGRQSILDFASRHV